MSVLLEVTTAKNTLQEIAAQAYGLGMGLQNAAPVQAGGPSKSVQYLLEISLKINKISHLIDQILEEDDSTPKL